MGLNRLTLNFTIVVKKQNNFLLTLFFYSLDTFSALLNIVIWLLDLPTHWFKFNIFSVFIFEVSPYTYLFECMKTW